VTRITETLVIDRIALMVADESANAFRAIRAEGFVGDPPPLQIDSAVGARVRAGHHVALDDPAALRRAGSDEIEFWRVQGVHYLIPCVSAQTASPCWPWAARSGASR